MRQPLQPGKCGSLMLDLALCVAVAQAVQVWVPDSMHGLVGDTIDVPILISGHSGRGIIAADFVLGFREPVLTATNGFRLGNSAPGWMVVANPYSCSLLVAMASANPLAAGDTLLIVRMVVDSADTSRIAFLRCWLNEGQVVCTTRAGKFYGDVVGLQESRGAWTERGRQFALPSPVRDVVYLGLREPTELLSSSGQKVLTLVPGPNNLCLLPRGIYFCRLPAGESTATTEMVKTE